nr:glycosyltransferase family 4 protein [uncultured Allomuricauda sp.]
MIRKTKVCLVGSEDAYKRISLANLLLKQGFEVAIMSSAPFECPKDIRFIAYDLNRGLNLFSDIKTILQYRRIFRREKFDIVQTFDTKPAFLVPLSYIASKTKVVRTVTGLGTIFMSDALKYKILRFVYTILHSFAKNKVSHTTFQNEDDRSFFLRKNLVTLENSSLIYGSGIDLDLFSEYSKKKTEVFTFICVGRLVYEKGIINYLEAAKSCIESNHNYRFLLVGPLEEKSKKLNSEILNTYSKYVEWLGPKSNIPELLENSDAFVLPTFREGFSRVLLEASALSIPSITSDVPGTREIVRHEKEGLLTPVNDSVALAKAMIQMASNESAYLSYAKNARDHVKQFSLKNIANAYIQLYSKLLGFNKSIKTIKPQYS